MSSSDFEAVDESSCVIAPLFSANRVLDFVFLGSEAAAQDRDFVVSNEVKYIVNCTNDGAALFSDLGVKYYILDMPRVSDPPQPYPVLDRQSTNGQKLLQKVFDVIDDARKQEEITLIHSHDGSGRSVVILAAYLVYRYHWPPKRALQFIATKRFNVRPDPCLVRLLLQWSTRLRGSRGGFRDIFAPNSFTLDLEKEEILHRNNFLNSMQSQPDPPPLIRRAKMAELLRRPSLAAMASVPQQTGEKHLRWADGLQDRQYHIRGELLLSELLKCPLFRPPNPGYSSLSPVYSVPLSPSPTFIARRPPSPVVSGGDSESIYLLDASTQLAPPISILAAHYKNRKLPPGAICVQPEQALLVKQSIPTSLSQKQPISPVSKPSFNQTRNGQSPLGRQGSPARNRGSPSFGRRPPTPPKTSD